MRQKVTLASTTPTSKPGSASSVQTSPKANESSNNTGALRYALHLRFLCPHLKKSSRTIQRCKSDPSSVPENNSKILGMERRFYLYNDMRVVFPQRHSDADEGKVIYMHLSLHLQNGRVGWISIRVGCSTFVINMVTLCNEALLFQTAVTRGISSSVRS